MFRKSILIADDEPEIREILAETLSRDYQVQFARTGNQVLEVVRNRRPDLLVLDVVMPEMNGLSVCETLLTQEVNRSLPIMMISGNSSSEMRAKAIALGAREFFEKPFRLEEILEKIRNQLSHSMDSGTEQEINGCTLNMLRRVVTHRGRSVELREIEFRLLKYLVDHWGVVCDRKKISEFIWGQGTESHRNLDPHISSLRRKLMPVDLLVSTAYGAGYKIEKI